MTKKWTLEELVENATGSYNYDCETVGRRERELRASLLRLGNQSRQISPADLSELESRSRDLMSALRQNEASSRVLTTLLKVQA